MKFVLNLQYGYYFLNLKKQHVEWLQKKFPQIEFVDLKNAIRDCDALATWPFDFKRFKGLLSRAKRLRWIQFSNVGVPPEYLELARERNWLVTNARGVASESISLHALSLILSAERGLNLAFQLQLKKKWDQKFFTEQSHGFDGLRGKILGIIGLGSIGTALAQKASALGMRIWGVKKNPRKALSGVERIFSPSSFHEMLRKADYIVLCLPLLRETKNLIGRKELSLMKENAFLINVARGGLIDEKALIKSLQSGNIAGAALDVAAEEPLPKKSPLFATPNLILTPHIAGLDRGYTANLVKLIAENLKRYLGKKPLKNQILLERGY